MERVGYIKQWRKEIDSAIWDMPPLYFKVWRWLLMNVDYKTGQWVGTYGKIANGVRWTENHKDVTPPKSQIREIIRYLNHLTQIGHTTSQTTSHPTITLTIVNWTTYQNAEPQPPHTPPHSYLTDHLTTTSHPSTYIERVKEVKEVQEVPHDMVVESTLGTSSHQNPNDRASLEAVRQVNNVLGRTGTPIKKHRAELLEQVTRIGMVGILNAIKPENTKREILNAKDYWPYAMAVIARFDPTEAAHQKVKQKIWMPPDSDQLEERRKEMAKRGISFLKSTVTETRKWA